MIIVTERLILRPWGESDAEYLFRCASDRGISDSCGWPAHANIDDSRRCIREVLSLPETYAVALNGMSFPIGCIALKTPNSICLDRVPGSMELGFWLAREYRGRGIITEAAEAVILHAFNELRVPAVWCGYFRGNQATERVCGKLGFRPDHSRGAMPTAHGEYRTVYYTKLESNRSK